VKPRCKRRVASKTADLAEQLYECFLGKIFGLSGILRHSQTQRVHAPVVAFVKLLKRRNVAFSSRDSQSKIGIWRRFRFRCGYQATVRNWEDFTISHAVVFSKRGATKRGKKLLIFTNLLRVFVGF
jgi:hypothetical protein